MLPLLMWTMTIQRPLKLLTPLLATLTAQTESSACTAVAPQPALPTALLGTPGDRGWAGGAPGSQAHPCSSAKTRPARLDGVGCGWKKEWLFLERMAACGGGGGKRSPNITESTSAGTYTEGRKLSPSLHPTSTLSQSSPCFPSLPTSSDKICFSYEFGPLLAPTRADRAPACHPFPWTHDSGNGPNVRTRTTQRSLVGSEFQGRLRWVGQHSSHLNTSILCHPRCWQLASASPDESLNSFRANLHLND